MIDRERLAQLYHDGLSLQKIGQEFGVSKQRIHQLLQKLHLPDRPLIRRNRVQFDHDAAIRSYKSGHSLTTVAREQGVCHSTIRNMLIDRKTARRSAGNKHYPRPVEEMRRWYVEDGLTLHQIAAKLDRKYTWVRQVLVQAGVRMRPPGPQNCATAAQVAR